MTTEPTTAGVSAEETIAADLGYELTVNGVTLLADADRYLNPQPVNRDHAAPSSPPSSYIPEELYKLLERIDGLRQLAGPAITAPLTTEVDVIAEAIRRQVHAQELAEGRLAVACDRLTQANRVIRHVPDVLVELGTELANWRRDGMAAIRAETHARLYALELEQIIRDEGRSSGRRLTPGMAAARLRQASQRAANAAEQKLAARFPRPADTAPIVDD